MRWKREESLKISILRTNPRGSVQKSNSLSILKGRECCFFSLDGQRRKRKGITVDGGLVVIVVVHSGDNSEREDWWLFWVIFRNRREGGRATQLAKEGRDRKESAAASALDDCSLEKAVEKKREWMVIFQRREGAGL
ncbi:hypothetical protein HAX54_031067, partial [Datura stramonium]|nr:hypothetical protein [Datura stramonium]